MDKMTQAQTVVSVFDRIRDQIVGIEERKRSARMRRAARAEYVLFRINSELYAVKGRHVSTILKRFFFSPLYGVPERLAGIFGYQGEICSLFHLDLLLGLPHRERPLALVLKSKDMTVGFLLDEVEAAWSPDGRLEKKEQPDSLPSFISEVVDTAIGKAFVLDADKLMASEAVWV